MDRANQLGPLRAWVAGRHEDLLALLTCGRVLYGEWLWLQHGVAYDGLPDWLVGLDVWHPEDGFSTVSRRDSLLSAAGLLVPPLRFVGVPQTYARLVTLLGASAWSGSPAEGLVLRRGVERCKVVDPGFSRRSDAEWARGRRRNTRRAEDAAGTA